MITMIAAHDDNRVIGNGPDIPWHAPDDWKFFKDTTMGKTMVMGRKTFESIGKPLPGRETIVLTSDPNYSYNNVQICNDYKRLVGEYGSPHKELYIAGGTEIYKLFLPYADKLLITHIHGEYEGDIIFPEYATMFKQTYSKEHVDSKTELSMTFMTFTR